MVSLAYKRQSSIKYISLLLKKFITKYKKTMLAQYLVSLGATNLRKSKTKSVKAVDFPQVSKERTFHVQLLHGFPKVHFTTRLQAQPRSYSVLHSPSNLGLVFL